MEAFSSTTSKADLKKEENELPDICVVQGRRIQLPINQHHMVFCCNLEYKVAFCFLNPTLVY